MKKLINEVYEEIKPNQDERRKLQRTTDKLMEKIEKIREKTDPAPKPKLVGSAARETWLRGEQDIDIFLLFPENISREKLEEKGLEIGKKATNGQGREQYAEHPYTKATIDGFDIDIVPCFDIEDPSEIKSSVDRTPHHQDYVEKELTPEMKKDVLILKRFLKGIGAYGSELRTHGFSGYLSELLIIHYGSFPSLIESAKDWGDKKTISNRRSSEELEKIFPKDPLIYEDPVDPKRNVAAAVSKKNHAKFVRASQEFFSDPKKEFFFPKPPVTSTDTLKNILSQRKSKLLMVEFDIPFDLVPDIIYPQLRKTNKKLVEELEDKKFEVLRSEFWSGGSKGIILLEFAVSELSGVRKHTGPPLGVNGKAFTKKHAEAKRTMTGPYLDENGRLNFELERDETHAREALEGVLETNEGFGKHVGKSIDKEGFTIFEDEGCIDRARELEIKEVLGDYLTRRLPWYR